LIIYLITLGEAHTGHWLSNSILSLSVWIYEFLIFSSWVSLSINTLDSGTDQSINIFWQGPKTTPEQQRVSQNRLPVILRLTWNRSNHLMGIVNNFFRTPGRTRTEKTINQTTGFAKITCSTRYKYLKPLFCFPYLQNFRIPVSPMKMDIGSLIPFICSSWQDCFQLNLFSVPFINCLLNWWIRMGHQV
jgi:hypothetical protein